MSVEALAFAKLTDLDDAEGPSARLLFYVIAENTFNDTGLCKVGKAELAYQMRASASTVQRQAQALEAAGKIKVRIRAGEGVGRKPDEIELLGFKKWLSSQRATAAGSSVSQNGEPQNIAGAIRQVDVLGNPSKRTKKGGGNPSLVTGSYKDTRTSTRTREGANSNLKSEVTGPDPITLARARNARGKAPVTKALALIGRGPFPDQEAANEAFRRALWNVSHKVAEAAE